MRGSKRVESRSRQALRIAARSAVIALLVAACGDGGGGGNDSSSDPTLTLSSPVTDSLVATVCLRLDSAGEEIAGTQNDIVWEPSCATLSEGSCSVRAGDVTLSTALRDSSSMRAFVFSFVEVEPLPDGDLYCCEFVVQLMDGACCPLRLERVRGATPDGTFVPMRAIDGEICPAGTG